MAHHITLALIQRYFQLEIQSHQYTGHSITISTFNLQLTCVAIEVVYVYGSIVRNSGKITWSRRFTAVPLSNHIVRFTWKNRHSGS